jgi:hypothetical protein
MTLHFCIGSIMVLGRLVLRWASLVQMGVQHLVPDQLLLSLSVGQIIQIVGYFKFTHLFLLHNNLLAFFLLDSQDIVFINFDFFNLVKHIALCDLGLFEGFARSLSGSLYGAIGVAGYLLARVFDFADFVLLTAVVHQI